jgi:phosphate-selective porin OprO and OprP
MSMPCSPLEARVRWGNDLGDMNRGLTFVAFFSIGLSMTHTASAMEPVVQPSNATGLLTGEVPTDDLWNNLWTLPTLYKNPANPYVQDLALIGQIQTQYAYGSENDGSYGTADLPEAQRWGNIEVRRFRLGLRAKMFGKLSFLNLMDLNADFEPRIYKRTPENYFTWTENDAFQLSAGKTELKFDREQEYSSKEFPLFERTALGNMFYGGELTGVWASGKGIAGGWLYFLGIYDNDRQDEWTDFEGGTIILSKIGYNYTKATGLDQAECKLQLLHNTEPGFRESPNELASPQYSNCLSLSNEIVKGPYGLTVEALWGDGENGRADVFGVSAMPFWYITDKLQWISEFELAASPQENGIILPARYEALAPATGDDSGDNYFSAYTGLTYYVRGHDLKLMSGVKYSHMTGGTGGGDFNDWTWLAGMRIAF